MRIHDAVRALLDRGSRQELSRDLGVSQALLSQWASGKELITEAHLTKLVDRVTPGAEATKQAELLRLLLLLAGERTDRAIEADTASDSDKRRWTEASRALMHGALGLGLELARKTMAGPEKTRRRTLCDFPFYPLAIVSGEKREQSSSRITAADFGAVSASHAEFRWLPALGLRADVELYGDKVFVLETAEELHERFGQTHLLIVGSPGSNHLARRCLLAPPPRGWTDAAPLFRFNLSQHTLGRIEQFIDGLAGLRAPELAGKRVDESVDRDMRNWLRYLFAGGILDPTHTDHWLRGIELPPSRDYGLITLARNPFSNPDDPRLCVMVAGIHMFGTAHALRMLANPGEHFAERPFGGVIEVSIDLGQPFAKRFDSTEAVWDTEAYNIVDLRERLKRMRDSGLPAIFHITPTQIGECERLLDEL